MKSSSRDAGDAESGFDDVGIRGGRNARRMKLFTLLSGNK